MKRHASMNRIYRLVCNATLEHITKAELIKITWEQK